MTVKVFSLNDPQKLEDAINLFIASLPGTVVDNLHDFCIAIQYSVVVTKVSGVYYTALLSYK